MAKKFYLRLEIHYFKREQKYVCKVFKDGKCVEARRFNEFSGALLDAGEVVRENIGNIKGNKVTTKIFCDYDI